MHASAPALLAAWWAVLAPDIGRVLVERGNDQGVPRCASCHAPDGSGAGNGERLYPRLAGMGRQYFMRQMADYRSGRRLNDVMQPIAGLMSDDQVEAVAAYYEGMTAPNRAAPNRARIDLGRDIAMHGRWERKVPGCEQCHGPGGAGVSPSFPALAGQQAEYLEQQLMLYRGGGRTNDPNALMRLVTTRLSVEELAAAAAYFASLEPPSPRGGRR